MEKITLTAHYSERCDKYAAENTEGISRSYIKKLSEEGRLLVNGTARDASYRLKCGDEMEILLPEAREIEAKAEDIPLDIVYEDGDVLVINKPRGMVVHPAPGNETGTVVNAVLFHCGDNLSGINGALRPGIVHRIDKDTTGLLAVAKTDAAHASLTEQLASRTLSREYYALVHGVIKEDAGKISAPIARSENDRKKMAVAKKGGREAVTEYEVTERLGNYTFVKCRLRTGRTHQIRVHMRHIGHPIVGDKTYGVKKEEFALEGQLLHAGKIGFIHPSTGEKLTFTAPLPDDFSHVLDVLHAKYDRKD